MARLGKLAARGLLAPVKALLPKNPWLRVLLYALPILLLLAFFGPALEVVLRLMEFVLQILQPMLQTTVGRILLVMALISVTAAVLCWLLRTRVREMRAEAILGRHLFATAALVSMDRRHSREQFRRVARYRGPTPARYPHVVQDAQLKLARLALEADDVDGALGWLARVVEPGLPKELQRSMLQLRLDALRRQGQVLPATLRREAEAALQRFKGDVVVLRVLRELSETEGKVDEAISRQEQIVANAAPAGHPIEQQRLVDMLSQAGRRALDNGDFDRARKVAHKLQKADPKGGNGSLLAGDVHRAANQPRKAVQLYGKVRSPAGLDRIAELLSERPGAVEIRELLAWCPLQGILLVVARELARAGELDRAKRAARVAAEALGPTPTVCAVLAEVLELLGDRDKASLLREETVARLLVSPAREVSRG